jgi:hypothetical protein
MHPGKLDLRCFIELGADYRVYLLMLLCHTGLQDRLFNTVLVI